MPVLCAIPRLASVIMLYMSVTAISADEYANLVTFDDVPSTTFDWRAVADPVMGGRSVGSFEVNKTGEFAHFKGEVKIVPSLHAPGFVNMQAQTQGSRHFNDASEYTHIQLKVRTVTPEYKGWKIEFGPADHSTGFFSSYKSDWNFPAGYTTEDDFVVVEIPFTKFSSKWSSYTGEPEVNCSVQHPEVCPSKKRLSAMTNMEINAEGSAGKFSLDVAWIRAVNNAKAENTISSVEYVDLVTFDGQSGTTWTWIAENDPVMGGQSKSTFTTDKTNNVAVWDGEVKIVPSLKAPGFCFPHTTGIFKKFNDASKFEQISMRVRSTVPYDGFFVSFVADTLNTQFGSFKSPFHIDKSTSDWQTVSIPFSNFSNKWSSTTGQCTTCCSQNNPEVCPSEKNLHDITQFGLWAEGSAGKFHLEIDWIRADSAPESVTLIQTNDFTDTYDDPLDDLFCKGDIQSNLRYNMSADRGADSGFPFPLGPSETLPEAVCCDDNFRAYAEPRDFFQRDDVKLFEHLSTSEPTTFYDSVCGIPLFIAPRNRTMSEFHAETIEHGWPSFRNAELASPDAVKILSTGEVVSKCGTHLGSNLPDEKGTRYCLDLSCISGNPASTTPR